MALKRQQAAEDAIALHLASAENGTTYDYLPPGRIYGMQVTSPETETGADDPPPLDKQEQQPNVKEDVSVSPASIEMLGKLFPNKKRAVLELVLKRLVGFASILVITSLCVSEIATRLPEYLLILKIQHY